jgi:hypothetical protein
MNSWFIYLIRYNFDWFFTFLTHAVFLPSLKSCKVCWEGMHNFSNGTLFTVVHRTCWRWGSMSLFLGRERSIPAVETWHWSLYPCKAIAIILSGLLKAFLYRRRTYSTEIQWMNFWHLPQGIAQRSLVNGSNFQGTAPLQCASRE